MKKLLLLAATLFCTVALAQTTGTSVSKSVGQTSVVTWAATTTYVGGTAIPSGTAVTYNVYESQQANGACSYTSSPAVTGVTALTWTTPAYTSPGVYCYAVSAVAGGMESALSSSVTATVTNPVPNGVSGLQIH